MKKKLADLIGEVKRDKTVENLKTQLNTIKVIYEDIYTKNNFRIHDDSGEGIFSSNQRDCVLDNGHIFKIGKNTRDTEGEEAFSRAIFNGTTLSINNTTTQIIAYETPLLRKKEAQSDSLVTKCDLLAYHDQTIYAIEYKKNWGPNTDIQYGLVEGLIYGEIIAKHIKNYPEEVQTHLSSVARKHHRPITLTNKPSHVSFVLCGPANFFRRPLNNSESIKKTKEMEKVVFEYLAQQNNSYLSFGGYVVCGEDDDDLKYNTITLGGRNVYIPSLFCLKRQENLFARNVSELWEKL